MCGHVAALRRTTTGTYKISHFLRHNIQELAPHQQTRNLFLKRLLGERVRGALSFASGDLNLGRGERIL